MLNILNHFSYTNGEILTVLAILLGFVLLVLGAGYFFIRMMIKFMAKWLGR
jgi:Kef-type K+ transport system membrane component KefB